MRSVILAALVLALAPLTLSAQVMGSTNNDAPVLAKSISFQAGGMLAIDYTAIGFGQGGVLERIKNNERMRNFVNRRAQANPLMRVEIKDSSMKVGGKTVAPGKYAFYFLALEGGKWQLVAEAAKGGGDKLTWDLSMKKTDKMAKRFSADLKAVEDPNQAHLHIGFGPLHMAVPIERVASK